MSYTPLLESLFFYVKNVYFLKDHNTCARALLVLRVGLNNAHQQRRRLANARTFTCFVHQKARDDADGLGYSK